MSHCFEPDFDHSPIENAFLIVCPVLAHLERDIFETVMNRLTAEMSGDWKSKKKHAIGL